MEELVIESVSKVYGKKTVLEGIDATLHHGVYGLLGENGAGKTTLMRIICGILAPTGGRILADGETIQKMDGRYRRLLGYLPQDFGYYPDYTAWRFLMYLAALKALPGDYAKERVAELLELVNLTEERDKKLKTFSGGMLKRLGIAQALLNEPKLLILDEPTSGLDPKERVRFRNIVSSLGRERTIILSTHIVSDIEYIADEILMMKNGKLIASGNLEAITAPVKQAVWECVVDASEAEKLSAAFLVSNLKNLPDGVLLRIISDKAPQLSDVQKKPERVVPTLEDAYLFYLGKL